MLDYKKIRGAINVLLSSGATADSIHLDVIAAEVDVSNAWKMYRDLAIAVSPTSADAERVFSTLSRLRSKFRGKLHVQLSACVRVSQSKTLGAGSVGDEVNDEILKDWSSVKQHRERPLGLATRPHKRPRLAQALSPNALSDAETEPKEEEPGLVEPVAEQDRERKLRAAQVGAQAKLAAYFVESASESESD